MTGDGPGESPGQTDLTGALGARRELQDQIAALTAAGLSMHHIGRQLGIGYGTAWQYIRHVK